MRPPDGLRGVITDDGDGDMIIADIGDTGEVIPLLAPKAAAAGDGDVVDVDDGRRM